MATPSIGDYRKVLDLVTESLRCTGPEFPEAGLVEAISDVVDAGFAGAGEVDFRGRTSRRWADIPRPMMLDDHSFHELAVRHPLAVTYRRAHSVEPLRLSDVAAPRSVMHSWDGRSMPYLLTIPLANTSRYVRAIALLRHKRDFRQRDLEIARLIQPVLGEILARHAPGSGPRLDPDLDTPLTVRELAVLDLMADGLIAAAIARSLGISARTVGKHIENIYRKLECHDRTSAVLRGQARGFVSTPVR